MEDASLQDFLEGGEDEEADEEADEEEAEKNAGEAGKNADETREPADEEVDTTVETPREAADGDDSTAATPSEAADEETPATRGDTGEEGPVPGAAPEGAPLVGTYSFTPSGASCAACGEVVDRRWQAESGLVCPACKSW